MLVPSLRFYVMSALYARHCSVVLFQNEVGAVFRVAEE